MTGRTELLPGVFLTAVQDRRFKTACFSLSFLRHAQRVGAGAAAERAGASGCLCHIGLRTCVRLPVQPCLYRLGLSWPAAQLSRADLSAVFLRVAVHCAAGGISGRWASGSGSRRIAAALQLILIRPTRRPGRVPSHARRGSHCADPPPVHRP